MPEEIRLGAARIFISLGGALAGTAVWILAAVWMGLGF